MAFFIVGSLMLFVAIFGIALITISRKTLDENSMGMVGFGLVGTAAWPGIFMFYNIPGLEPEIGGLLSVISLFAWMICWAMAILYAFIPTQDAALEPPN